MGGNTVWDELRDGWMNSVPRVALRLDAAFSFALERVFVVSNASRVGVLGNHACDTSGDTSDDTSGDTSGDTFADISLLPLSDDVDPRSVGASSFRFFFRRARFPAAASTHVRRARARVVQRTEQSERLELWRRDQGDGAWWFKKNARADGSTSFRVEENVRDVLRREEARDDGVSRRRGESRGGGGHDEASDERLAGEFAREGTIVDGDEGVDAFGRVAVFRGASRVVFVDPGENLDGTVRGARGAVLGGARLEAQAPGGERAGDGGARAGRATPVAREDQTRARPIDDGAEVIQEFGLERARPGRGRGKGQQTVVVTCCEDEPTARHGALCGSATARRTFGSPTPRPRRGRALSSRLETARGDVVRERSDRERGVAVETYAGRGSGVAGVTRALVRFSR